MTKAKKTQNKRLAKGVASVEKAPSTRPDPLGVKAVRRLRSSRARRVASPPRKVASPPRNAASPPPRSNLPCNSRNLSKGDMRHSLDARRNASQNRENRESEGARSRISEEAIENALKDITAAQARLHQLLEEQQSQRRVSLQERLRKGKYAAEDVGPSKINKTLSLQRTEASDTGSSTPKNLNPENREQTRRSESGRNRLSPSRGVRVRNPQQTDARGQRNLQCSTALENRARRDEHCWRSSPFSRDIEQTEPPRRFTVQTFKRYAGKTDPMEHILHYEQMMTLYRGHEALMCKVFPSTLEGSATTWFSKLPARSIQGWGQLVKLFLDRFVANNKPERGLSDLLAVKKKEGESIREFSQRYLEMANEVEDCPPNLIAASFKMGLPQGSDLFKELAKRPPKNINELLITIDEHARLEDALVTMDATDHGRTYKSKGEVNPRVKSQALVKNTRGLINMVFTSPLEEILMEVKNEEFFRWPPKLQGDPDRRSKEFHCAYHQTHGHSTEVCRQLRSHLDELAERGHLTRFINREGSQPKTKNGELRVIEVIHGFMKGQESTSRELRSHNRALAFSQQVNSIQTSSRKRSNIGTKVPLFLGFSDADLEGVTLPHKDALVVTLQIGEKSLVKRVFIDPGSNTEILYLPLFLKMGFKKQDLTSEKGVLIGFGGLSTYPLGTISLPVVVHGVRTQVEFVVVDAPSPYNAILGRGWLHEMRAVPSTLHQKLKFPTSQGIKELRGDQQTARECCTAAMVTNPTSEKPLTSDARRNLTEDVMEVKSGQ